MPLVNAKCTNCGANLNVDNIKDAAVCEFCGSAFIVEKAINNYNVTNNNSIYANVVNIYECNNLKNKNIPLEQLLKESIDMFDNANLSKLLSPEELKRVINIVNTNRNEDTPGISKLMHLFDNYCEKLNFKIDFNYINTPLSYDFIKHECNDGYAFIKWIEYKTTEFDGEYEILKKMQEKVTDYYIKLLKSGLVGADWCETGPTLWGVKRNKYGEFSGIESKINNFYLIKYFNEGINTAKKYASNYIFCLGNYSIEIDTCSDWGCSTENYNGKYLKEYSKNAWIADNKCQHCGGEFKGLFNKVCSKCGKPKDY